MYTLKIHTTIYCIPGKQGCPGWSLLGCLPLSAFQTQKFPPFADFSSLRPSHSAPAKRRPQQL